MSPFQPSKNIHLRIQPTTLLLSREKALSESFLSSPRRFATPLSTRARTKVRCTERGSQIPIYRHMSRLAPLAPQRSMAKCPWGEMLCGVSSSFFSSFPGGKGKAKGRPPLFGCDFKSSSNRPSLCELPPYNECAFFNYPDARAGSKGLPFFSTPKITCNSFRIHALLTLLSSLPGRSFNLVARSRMKLFPRKHDSTGINNASRRRDDPTPDIFSLLLTDVPDSHLRGDKPA